MLPSPLAQTTVSVLTSFRPEHSIANADDYTHTSVNKCPPESENKVNLPTYWDRSVESSDLASLFCSLPISQSENFFVDGLSEYISLIPDVFIPGVLIP
jgi:hypothetical protein